MRWYVYKCNAGHRVGPYRGDWKLLFDRASQSEEGTGSWGSDEIVEELGRLEIGDNILAYQTDTNSLMGHLVVVE